MHGLKLRDEFLGKHLKGTAIEIANSRNSGAVQQPADKFLEITYPTADLLRAMDSVGQAHGRPVVLIGERGMGKSHLLASLHHALKNPEVTSSWLDQWDGQLSARPALRPSMHVISESLHRQKFASLWEVLFDHHPHGAEVRGMFKAKGTDWPGHDLIMEMVNHTPTAILLDEFQTWYDGLGNDAKAPYRNRAFGFIQVLSEVAKEAPDKLVLVISVRNGNSDAYQQIHRVNPILVDFRAAGSPELIQRDRRNMLLHRLFTNRRHVAVDAIEQSVGVHVSEYFRLLSVPAAEQDRRRDEFVHSWPFAPHLLQLLEDQILVASDAQETRDLIKILAGLFKSRGESQPILTAADFSLEDDDTGIAALLDSVANEAHRDLREKAMRNQKAVMDSVADHRESIPHLRQILPALWLRSISADNQVGADPAVLHADITHGSPVDDNLFQIEIAGIEGNGFNIHRDGKRLVFRRDENPQAKLLQAARNDKLFQDGQDHAMLAKVLRYAFEGDAGSTGLHRILPLPRNWLVEPWSSLAEVDKPQAWADLKIPVLVVPEDLDKLDATLGKFLKEHLQTRRNTVRFLLQRAGSVGIYQDRDLLVMARAIVKAEEWGSSYHSLKVRYQKELAEVLRGRFTRFAVLSKWSFTDSAACRFHLETVDAQGAKALEAIKEQVHRNLFVQEDFEEFVVAAAEEGKTLGALLRELQEPRANGQECIPWLGEAEMMDRVLLQCARGKIAINLRGSEFLQLHPGESFPAASQRLKSRLNVRGRQLEEVTLMLPHAVPVVGESTPGQATGADIESPPEGGDLGGLQTGTGTPAPGGNEPPGPIFVQTKAAVRRRLENPTTSSLNLLGKMESWGIAPATRLEKIQITLDAATGAQLKDLLKKLPDGLTYGITLEKEDI
jgi:hypothetical protein